MQGLAHQQGGQERDWQDCTSAVPRAAAAAALRLRCGGTRLPRAQGHCHCTGTCSAGRTGQPRGWQCAGCGRGSDKYRLGTPDRRSERCLTFRQLDVALPLAEGRGCPSVQRSEGSEQVLLRTGHQRAHGQGLAVTHTTVSQRREDYRTWHGHRECRRRGERRTPRGIACGGERQERIHILHRLQFRCPASGRFRLGTVAWCHWRRRTHCAQHRILRRCL